LDNNALNENVSDDFNRKILKLETKLYNNNLTK